MSRRMIARALWFIESLEKGRALTATDIAREWQVSVRTAYRDLDALRDDWRLPLEYDAACRLWRLTGPIDGALRRLVA